MKAILIFTAALMTGASIYGVASYNKLSRTKDFKELYLEKKEPPKKEPIATEKKEPVLAETKKPEKKISNVKKTKSKHVVPTKEKATKELVTKDELLVQELSEQFIAEQSSSEAKEKTASTTTEQPKKVKRLRGSMFSRAALRDE